MQKSGDDLSDSTFSIVPGHLPKKDEIISEVGHFQILKEIGKGGMGEVYLAYDTICGRKVALKTIRKSLASHTLIRERFLREARITSQLMHPSIVPIYSLHQEGDLIYYTMPYVEGETLKQVLRKTRGKEKKRTGPDHLDGSIPSLVRVFLPVCQAVAYAHANGILHRDLKPENIILGPFGEVLILDWGLAGIGDCPAEESDLGKQPGPHTRVGKIVGTVSYMAPERAFGAAASEQSEIYALGVILFQILTLRMPFSRPPVEEWRKTIKQEQIPNPSDWAPYRDVPKFLSRICLKCLQKDPSQRYQTVTELTQDIENYLEGGGEWFDIATLETRNKSHWEFQENVLIAEHTAITSKPSISDWVNLMISKASFAENIRLMTRVKIGPTGQGIGFLLGVPEQAERTHLNDGYSLWVGSDLHPVTRLTRSTVEVLSAPEITLERGKWHTIAIEKIEHNFFFYLDGQKRLTYVSHLPLTGKHVGVVSWDADYELEPIHLSVKSQTVTVNCLAVPDAFLSHKLYAAALAEYRRIGYSFSGRAEGREAMFRAGVTILEEGKNTKNSDRKNNLFEQSLSEFEKLHHTPGAPLEYLGKALVYQAWNDFDEETKCYELAFRRFPNHPLIPLIQEHLIYRMHTMSRVNRRATYRFVLTAIRHFPKSGVSQFTKTLCLHLQADWEQPLFFLPPTQGGQNSPTFLAIQLAFWLDDSYALLELSEQIARTGLPEGAGIQANICRALIALSRVKEAKQMLTIAQLPPLLTSLVSLVSDGIPPSFKEKVKQSDVPTLLLLCDWALKKNEYKILKKAIDQLAAFPEKKEAEVYLVSMWLLKKDYKKAGALFSQYPAEELASETNRLFVTYGCWLAATKGAEASRQHFFSVLDQPFPPTWILLAHSLKGQISTSQGWVKKAFVWEVSELKWQISLYNHCLKEKVGGENSSLYTS